MKKFLIALLALWMSAALASPQAELNKLIYNNNNPSLKNVNIGVMIASMDTKQVIYQYNADHLYSPASVQKLFTATAALAYLTPGFQFKTQAFVTGKVTGDTLHGNLYIKFSGDPSLKTADLSQILKATYNHGIHKIDGGVYLDNSDYNWVPYPPGWIWDDLSYNYAAPINAIILNKNKFSVHIVPGTLGHAPVVSSNLPAGVVTFNNQIITTQNYHKDCPVTVYSNEQNIYRLGGCFNHNLGDQRRSLAIRDIVKYARAVTKELLRQNNISYNNAVQVQQTPAGAQLVAEHVSEPLAKLERHMLKKSDNLYTSSILKKVGQEYFKRPGTWQDSLEALKEILGSRTGINFKNTLINDGAGLSRYNLLSPHQFVQLLYYIDHNNAIRGPLINDLPIAGVDGTLAYRMPSLAKDFRVRAKTGSMTGISSLAGYVYTKHHGVMAFAIIVNNFTGSRRPYTKLENQICEYLANMP